MDFGYAKIVLLLLYLHVCIGQDGTELNFEVKVSPEKSMLTENLDSSVVLSCSVVSKSQDNPAKPTLRWELDGTVIDNTDKNNGPYIEDRDVLYMLRLEKIKDSDSGTYKCIATLNGQEDSRSIKLEVVKPLTIKSSANQNGVKGKDGNVMCEVTAKPAPTVTWKFENGTMIKNSEKYIIQSDRLIVKNLDFSDDLTYICDIIVTQTGKTKMLAIDFLVVELPVIALPPTIEPNNPTVGNEVKIHCTATGVPTPTYDFQKDGSTIPESQIDSVSGILTIPDLKRGDQATYKCIASNPGGSVESSNTLDVLIPPVIKDIVDVDKAVEEGKQEIVCEAEGDPAPIVSWKKKGMETDFTEDQDHPKIVTESNSQDDAEIKVSKSIMTFDPVKAQDAGSYVCTANSIVGAVTKEVKMAVMYKPHFDVDYQQKTFYGWEGHQTNITCQASANGLASINWKRKNPVDPEVEETLSTDGPFTVTDLVTEDSKFLSTRSLLVFINNDDSMYGEYICEASNTLGSKQNVLTLIQASSPGKPVATISERMSTTTSFVLKKPAQDGGQPVTKFKYSYYPADDMANMSEEEADVAGDDTIITLKGLKPSADYVLKVSAGNAVGLGQEESLSFKTREVSKPQMLEVASEPVGDKSNAYVLKWKEPEDGGSAILKYILKYREVKVEGKKPKDWKVINGVVSEFTTIEVKGSNHRSSELKGLNRDTYYEVRIMAVNAQGSSDPAFWLFKTIKGNDTDEAEENAGGSASTEEASGKDGESATNSPSKDSSDAASLGSGIIILIIIIIIVVLLTVVIVVYFVTKKRRAAGKGDAEGGKKDDGKETAEEEKLIDNAKTENENEKKEDGVEETQEFEPDQKPEQPVTDPADDQAKDGPQTEPTIQITPETPEKPENPSA